MHGNAHKQLHAKWDSYKRNTMKTKEPTQPDDFSFNKRGSKSYRMREEVVQAKTARMARREEQERKNRQRRKVSKEGGFFSGLWSLCS